jgi:ABC-type transport system involved in multi-copper enzyme maturation permease subunit
MISQGSKKELRLLFPEWITALLLASTPLAFFLIGQGTSPNQGSLQGLQPITLLCLAIGCVWLATAILGKENNFGTLEPMLSLPITRQQLWREKCFAAFTTIGTTTVLYVACIELAYLWTPPGAVDSFSNDYRNGIGFILLCSVGPALLFTSYLCRSHEAFWMTLLAPFGILVVVVITTPESLEEYQENILTSVMIVYGLVTLWFARKRILSWEASSPANQNIVIRLPGLRGKSVAQPSQTYEGLKAGRSILLKELRTHQLTLVCTLLFAMIYGVAIITLRHENWYSVVTEELIVNIRLAWLLIPTMIGAAAIAEERHLGVTSWHSTLPVSRLQQWRTKILVALGLGFVLGAIVPWPLDYYLLNTIGSAQESGPTDPELSLLLKLLGWGSPVFATIVGFYASSMARSLLQGIFFSVLITIALFFQMGIANHFINQHATVDPTLLIYLVTALVVGPVMIFHSFQNYPVQQSFRSLIKPLLAIWIVTTCLISSVTTAAFSRFWEPWLPLSPIVHRAASPNTQAQIIRDYWGFTILSTSGKLYHLSQQWEETPSATPSIRPIGPNQTWKSVTLADRNRFAINQDGTLWTWHRSQDLPQLYQQVTGPPSIIDSPIPWEQISVGTKPKSGFSETYLYGLKTDGSFHITQRPTDGMDYKFQAIPHSVGFRSIVTTDYYVLAITDEGKLAFIGTDLRYLLHEFGGFEENNQLSPSSEDPFSDHIQDLTNVTILDENTEWRTIHILENAVRMPVNGYPYHLLGSDENRAQLASVRRFTSSTAQFPIAIFERADGSYWTHEWAAKAMKGHSSTLGESHRLVQLHTNLWKNTLPFPWNSFRFRRHIVIKQDGRLSEISRTDTPELPFFPEFRQLERTLSQRKDWIAIQSFFNGGPQLAVTENDILWSWGKPMEQLRHQFGGHSGAHVPLIPYQGTPRPFYDLREGKLISR